MSSLVIEDELTIFTALEQKNRLMGFLNSGTELEIDLSKVEEIDTAGL